MALDVFPALPGLLWDVKKSPEFATLVRRSNSLSEQRVALAAYPLWTFDLAWDLLRDDQSTQSPSSPYDELKQLVGFFLKQNGSLRAFAYTDPSDSAVSGQLFGTGDGATTQFQLVRTYGSSFVFAEPVQNVNAITNVKDNGVVVPPTTGSPHYTVNSSGLITFSAAPVAGHSLTWTGTYYYRVRFADDLAEFSEFMSQLWELKKLQFVGAVGNKV